MHNPFDYLAKKIGKEALDASGVTIIQYEVSRDAQHADLRHDPDPTRGAERACLGLLGRMAAVLCLIEIFAHAIDGAELRAVVGKHFAHWEECVQRTRARNRRRKEKGLPPEPVVEPMLWIIAVTVSAPMRSLLDARPAPGWPAGVYFQGGDLYRVGIVAAGELPRDRSTLLVRLMAAGPLLAEAVEDLAALPPDAPERAAAEGIVLDLQHRLGKKPSRTPEEEELIVTVRGSWEKVREEGRREGHREGEAAARARAVLTVLRVRGIPVPDAARDRILAERDPVRLERWHERAIVAASLAEVLDEQS